MAVMACWHLTILATDMLWHTARPLLRLLLSKLQLHGHRCLDGSDHEASLATSLDSQAMAMLQGLVRNTSNASAAS